MGVSMDLLMQDVRYGLRRLAASPLFTVLAVLIVGLGIAANTVVFSAVNSASTRRKGHRIGEIQATSCASLKVITAATYWGSWGIISIMRRT